MAESESKRDFLGYLLIIARQKRLIFRMTLGGLILSIMISFIWPKTYTGQVDFMIPQNYPKLINQVFMGQFSLGDFFNKGNILEEKTPQDFYADILNTPAIFDRIIERFDLDKLYDCDYREKTRIELNKRLKIEVGKGGLMALKVDDRDPERAAKMANAFIEELIVLLENLDKLDAEKRNKIFKRELEEVKVQLKAADDSLKNFREKTMLIGGEKQTESTVTYIAQLRALIDSKEVDLQVMKMRATPRNYEVVRLEEEISGLKDKLKILEDKNDINGTIFIPAPQFPDTITQYLQKMRDVKYYESLMELVAKLYAFGKIDKVNEAYTTSVLNWAQTPTLHTKPKRVLVVIGATFFSFFSAIMLIFIREYKMRLDANEEDAHRLQEFVEICKNSAVYNFLGKIRRKFAKMLIALTPKK